MSVPREQRGGRLRQGAATGSARREVTRYVSFLNLAGVMGAMGKLDENARLVESRLGVRLVVRGATIVVYGEEGAAEKAAGVLKGLGDAAIGGGASGLEEATFALAMAQEGRLREVYAGSGIAAGSIAAAGSADAACFAGGAKAGVGGVNDAAGLSATGSVQGTGAADGVQGIVSAASAKGAVAVDESEPHAVAGTDGAVCVTVRGKVVRPKTLGQRDYVRAVAGNTITFCIGPAGTGKTYLAVAMAVSAFKNRETERIILTRPAVEAGEKLGFLPGDLQNKVDPYLRPLHDALFDTMGQESYARYVEKGLIEIAPLAYMRGRTLDNSFIILDEAQNTTIEQMKMFLTRIGFGSRVVVTGDVTQIDLPPDKRSGLREATRILGGIDDIMFVHLNERDVVRHALVRKIIKAFEAHETRARDGYRSPAAGGAAKGRMGGQARGAPRAVQPSKGSPRWQGIARRPR